MNQETIGERIRYVRLKNLLTQREFAASIGVGRSALVRYETGEGFPSVLVAASIAETCGVSLNWLILGKGGYRRDD